MQKIESELDFRELMGFIKALSPREASDLTESLYTKELYSAHLPPSLRQDQRYPLELLEQTMEFRLPQISNLIKNIII
jgi:hypothetical protein